MKTFIRSYWAAKQLHGLFYYCHSINSWCFNKKYNASLCKRCEIIKDFTDEIHRDTETN